MTAQDRVGYWPVMHKTALIVAVGLSFAAGQPKPPAEPSPDSMRLFATKVQPILMNTCVACHTGGKGGKFELTRVGATASATAGATRSNFVAVAKFANGNADANALLKRSITSHGGTTRPPIKDANSPAYKHLEHWVRSLALEDKPARAEASPPTTANIRDEFDPEIFNRQTAANGKNR